MLENNHPILTHGNDDAVDSIIYRGAELSRDAVRVCTSTVTVHFRATDAAATISEIANIVSGDFSLRVFTRSWADSESPLIIHDPTGTIAGIMLPFNDLNPILSANEAESIAELSAEWITRKVMPK